MKKPVLYTQKQRKKEIKGILTKVFIFVGSEKKRMYDVYLKISKNAVINYNDPDFRFKEWDLVVAGVVECIMWLGVHTRLFLLYAN